MSMPLTVRGVTGALGRHAVVASKQQQQLPAVLYMRHTFAAAQRRQEQQQLLARSASTSARAPTTLLSEKEAMELLNKQRSLRPNSPHLTIYQPQLTWYGSIAHRITGVGLSGLLYVWAISYLALPYTPIGEIASSASLIHYASLAPYWLKLTLKAPLAFAASYHTWNGFRHLAWDYGYCLSMKGVYASGYTVIGVSVLTTIGLCLM
ncbi:hypothetical protein CBS101457_001491 [Exobasidium rhododendri]|nr:hypothetical protein CBS101457_001491 [Exobasidium rhododendri]